MVIGSGILGTLNNTGTLLLVIAVVMCFTGAANALNDVVDYEIDKINLGGMAFSLGINYALGELPFNLFGFLD